MHVLLDHSYLIIYLISNAWNNEVFHIQHWILLISLDIVSGLRILILYPFFWEGSWFLLLFEKNLSLTLVFLGLNNLFTIEGDGNCLWAGDWNLLLRDASIFFKFSTMFLMFILKLNVLLSNIQLIKILLKFWLLVTKINTNTN